MCVDRKIPARELRKMTGHLHLRNFRKPGRLVAPVEIPEEIADLVEGLE